MVSSFFFLEVFLLFLAILIKAVLPFSHGIYRMCNILDVNTPSAFCFFFCVLVSAEALFHDSKPRVWNYMSMVGICSCNVVIVVFLLLKNAKFKVCKFNLPDGYS